MKKSHEKLPILTPRLTTTDIMYSDHKKKIDCIEDANRKFLIFAHSQGNLFATQAYDYTTKIKNASADSVAAVHVAPVSPTLRGKHFLEDLDLVINGLRVFGEVPSITHYMSVLRAPGLNGKTDPLGHGLLEIYLNPTIDVEGDMYTEVTTLFDILEFPHNSDVSSNNNTDNGNGGNTSGDSGNGGSGNSGGGNTSGSFDYKSQCSSVSFPDPIPDELKTSIDEILQNNANNLVANVVCPLINGVIQAYNLSHSGGGSIPTFP